MEFELWPLPVRPARLEGCYKCLAAFDHNTAVRYPKDVGDDYENDIVLPGTSEFSGVPKNANIYPEFAATARSIQIEQ